MFIQPLIECYDGLRMFAGPPSCLERTCYRNFNFNYNHAQAVNDLVLVSNGFHRDWMEAASSSEAQRYNASHKRFV